MAHDLRQCEDVEILYDYWPTGSRGNIIITSRNPLTKDSEIGASIAIDVPPFEPGEVGPMLCSLAHREKEAKGLETSVEIAELLGGVPLAITQMAGIIRNRDLSLKDFLEYYREDAQRLQKLRAPGRKTNYDHTLSSVWAIEALSPESLVLLRVLSFLDPDNIPEIILTDGAKDVQLEHYPKRKSAYFEARLELVRTSVITRDTEHNSIRIHRLVQDVVRQKMTIEELSGVFEAVVVLISKLWPFVTWDQRNVITRWNQCEMLFPHVARLRSLFEEKIRAQEFSPSHRAAALFNEVAWYV